MNYNELANNIISKVGGENNVASLEHCSTRLRFRVKDCEKINKEELKNIKGIAGIKEQQEGIQVIIGQEVDEVYDEIMKNYTFSKNNKTSNNKKENINPVIKFMNMLADCFVPLIPALIAAGLMSAVGTLISSFGLMDIEGSTYKILEIMADAPLYFIPFLLANSAAKRFNVNPYITMAVTATLLFPSLSTLAAEGSNYTYLFGIPVRLATYSNSIIPVLLAVFAQKYIEKVMHKIIPKMLATFLEPLLTYFVLCVIVLIALGPVADYLSVIVAKILNFTLVDLKWLVCAVLGGTMILLISTGLHYSTMPIVIANFTMLGYDNFWAGPAFCSNLALAGAVLALVFKGKDKDTKQIAGSTGATALLGITEPAIYGVAFVHRKVLLSSCIAGSVGGLITGVLGVNSYGMAPAGLPALAVLAGPTFVNAIIAILVSFVLGFILSFIFASREEVK